MATKYAVTDHFSTSFTPDTSAYAANDVVGGLLTFESNARKGILTGAIIGDDDNEGAEYTLHLFDVVPTSIADNAAFQPSFADMQNWIGSITIASADYTSFTDTEANTFKVAWSNTQSASITFDSAVWGFLVATGTPTFDADSTIFIRLLTVGEN